jgi:hypothetical protein
MSFDLALHRNTHDLVFPVVPGSSRVEVWPIEGADRVAQQVKITLLAFLGEWFLDTTFGVPYLESILVKGPHMPSVETLLRARISAVPDVSRIEYLALDFDQPRRLLDVEFAAVTSLGPIRGSVTLEVTQRVRRT